MKRSQFDSPLPGFLAYSPLVALLSQLYGSIVTYRNRWFKRHPERCYSANIPVISIGGIRAGGTGKTPATMLLAEHLGTMNYTVGLLSRGYGRTSSVKSLLLAPHETSSWQSIGDEPSMLRAAIPAIWLGIGAKRAKIAEQLAKKLPEKSTLILDDGFQHQLLQRNFNIVCLHAGALSDRLLPQGYLREPLNALQRADHLFLIGTTDEHNQLQKLGDHLISRFPHLSYSILVQQVIGWVDGITGAFATELPLTNPIAVAGIARPDRFFNYLRSSKTATHLNVTFPDHHYYRETDISHLQELYSCGLITTEKDAVRLRELKVVQSLGFWYLKIRLQFIDNNSLNTFINRIKRIDI